MDPDRWRQVENIFHQVLDADEDRRASVLEESCAGDDALRREVESLLAQHEIAADFIEVPAFAASDAPAPQPRRSGNVNSIGLLAKTVIGHFRLLGKIGSGGMGVVYEAEDLKLRRRVALKFLPDEVAEDPQTLQRFRLEARAASALNHANICTIYEVDEVEGRVFIAMELLDGQTLKQLISGKPLPVETVLDLGIQIAAAIDAAHAKGIVHRDIKPANIFVTRQRRIKVLDFGIAKLMRRQSELDNSEATDAGVVRGTVGYMSPEQVRGQTVDHRTDIFALGAILYEMLVGRRPFERSTSAEAMSAVLNEEPPPISQIAPHTPPALVRVAKRCLEKNPEQRFQSASDLAFALGALSESGSAAVSVAGKRHRSRRGWTAAGVGAVVALAALLIAWWRTPPAVPVLESVTQLTDDGEPKPGLHRAPKLTDKDTIVLADFANSTGDPVFDDTLRQGMLVQLEQSPFLSLASDERIRKTLALMGQAADARLTSALARDLCERIGSAAVLDGSIVSLGSQYVLGLHAVNCRTGDVLDEEQVQAARKEDVLNALSRMASKFRARVGESLRTVEKHDAPLAEATTPSLEALKAYSAGWRVLSSTGSAAAVPFFKRAIEIDPKFAMAYAWLGQLYSDIGESTLSAENIAKAYQLQDRASDAEKFFITASYDMWVTGNLDQAEQTYELWVQAYPRATPPHGFLSGTISVARGNYEKSVDEANIAIGLDPDLAMLYSNLALTYVSLGRIDEAENAIRRASERKLEMPDFFVQRYSIAFLKGDSAGMEQEVAQAREKPRMEDWMSNAEGFVLAYAGHLDEARKMSRRAADFAREAERRETEAFYETDAALREALFGNASTARQRAMAALGLSNSRDVEYRVAFALAVSGDSSRSQTLTDDLSRRFPEDTKVRFTFTPTLRALLALNRNEPSKAVELLQTAIPYEGGIQSSGGSEQLLGAANLYPAYVRGEAYLAARRGREAAVEFQKILDHRGIVVSDPIGALAHLQLGRAYVLTADKDKARIAYKDFLTLWKEADPDVPILKEAKAEYARLQ